MSSDNAAPILSRADTVNLISALRFHDSTDDERAAIHLKLTTTDAVLRLEIQRLTTHAAKCEEAYESERLRHVANCRSLVDKDAEIQRLTEEIDVAQKVIAGDSITKARLTEERDAAQRFIRAAGYRHCDSAACNCDSWHGGHAMERLAEISDALPWANGPTILERAQSVVLELTARREDCGRKDAELSDLRAELAEAKDTLKEHEEEHWCFNAEHGQVIIERDRLRAELEAVKAAEGELEVWLCPVHKSLDEARKLEPLDNCIACIRAERNELRVRLEEAERDTKRLEWLESKWVDDESSPLTEYEGQWHADGMPNGPMTDDMRSAIDAAISQTAQPEEKR